MIGVEIMRRDIGGLIDGGEPGRLARIHQVEGDLGLAVDHYGLAGEALHVDSMTGATEGKLDPVMDQALTMGPRTCADFVQEFDRAFLQKAGADAVEHVLGRLLFQDDVVDAVGVKQLPEQQSRRARTDDCDFCPQYLFPPML